MKPLVEYHTRAGFTLIELSIVLVVIGLIVGGILTGRDLINAAYLRAQITQIEKYNTAVNTFKGKYDALPGDLDAQTASTFGFTARGTGPGEGNGNGVIEGLANTPTEACGFCVTGGESAVFWIDLTTANGLNVNLIDGSFTAASISTLPASAVTGPSIALYLPQAKIGNGNYIYVWAGGQTLGWSGSADANSDGQNYYGLSAVTQLGGGGNAWQAISSPGLTVGQAYAIDAKIDDGFPQSGRIKAMYLNAFLKAFGPNWAAGGGSAGASPGSTAAPSSTSCYDNGGSSSNPMQYSVEMNSGVGVNCALSFRFQ